MRDTKNNQYNGTWTDFHLKLWGEAIDATKATLLPMPTEEDDDNHDVTVTTTLPAATATAPPNPDATKPAEPIVTPSDHPDRPVNEKPSDTGVGAVLPTETEPEEETSPAETSGSSWVPGFLPTFGMSPATQAWIYGSLALIVVFCAGIGAYFFIMRRKRQRNDPRTDYEFELLDDDEAEGLASGEKGRKTRGGELYDAFAGDDEEEHGIDEHYSDRSGGDDEAARPLRP